MTPLASQWDGMKRNPMRRKARPEGDPAVFDLITPAGDRYVWPVKHQSEKDWQETVEGYAFIGDNRTALWHCNQTMRSRAGWFDLAIFQPTRRKAYLVELKVRDRKGVAYQASAEQKAFVAAAILSGLDARVWLYPDDEREVYEALTGSAWPPL